jgi:phosphohistidine phosphatase
MTPTIKSPALYWAGVELIVMRHAETGEGSPDHTRTLTANGRAAARAMGQLLAGTGPRPDRVLVSDARRTLETASLVLAAWPGFEGKPRGASDLYGTNASGLLHAIQRAAGGQRLLVVGHNPAVSELVTLLTGTATRLEQGCLAIMQSDLEWHALAPGGAQLLHLHCP